MGLRRMGICPITLTKFIGTFSLGLMTGTSFALYTLSLPSLPSLPTATSALSALSQLRQSSARTFLTLSQISSLSLITAFTLASKRNKHPYLLWTALTAFIAGQGIELYYNGFENFYLSPSSIFGGSAETEKAISGSQITLRSNAGQNVVHTPDTSANVSESGFIDVEHEHGFEQGMTNGHGNDGMSDAGMGLEREVSSSGSEADRERDGRDVVNGEKFANSLARERKVQFVRMCVSGVGLLMGIVGIWGDGSSRRQLMYRR